MVLVAYGSSDEGSDGEGQGAKFEGTKEGLVESHSAQGLSALPDGRPLEPLSEGRNGDGPTKLPATTSTATGADESLVEPVIGPTRPELVPTSPGVEVTSQPQSPYTANRSLFRDLTLPPIPNLDIPPSPPGSPRASTSAKFAHFLELKKQGVHFNEKLARSSALKNPSLLPKLMKFAGIEEEGQYAATLPKEVWDPGAFPDWAYKEELAKSQQAELKRREDEKAKVQRESLDFVPATASGDSSRGGTPGISAMGVRGPAKSAAERVMAGLDRERTRSPAASSNVPRDRRKRSRSR